MKLHSRLLLPCAALLFLGVGVAKADPAPLLFFNLTGPIDATFELPSAPVINPLNADPTCGFIITPIDLTINKAPSSDLLAFYLAGNGPTGCGGAFQAFPDGNLALSGNQLFTGTVFKPIFSPISGETLTDDNGGTYSLTISSPEPSSLLLLGMMLLPLGIAAKRLL